MEPELRNRSALSPAERRKVTRAAALRPLNILMLLIGGGFFAITTWWWVIPLTAVTYLSLVFLAARDPLFTYRVLEGRDARVREVTGRQERDISPERRARWLPRGETRQRVEAALDVYRRTVAAIEESDDVTRAVLEGAVPKLHDAANRLVDVAHNREKAAGTVRELESSESPPAGELQKLQQAIEAADAEISGTFESLLTLRARVVRISVETGPEARAAAAELSSSLDELNFRLEALGETMSPGFPRD